MLKRRLLVSLLLIISCSSEKLQFYEFGHFPEMKGASFPRICAVSHIDIFSDERMSKELDLIRSAGIELIRRDFIWSELEPDEGKYDNYVLSRYEKFVLEVRKRGMEFISLLVYGNGWASDLSEKCFQECGNCFSCNTFIPDPEKYSSFATFVVKMFSPKYIEVWNEPNWIFFMNPVSPSAYAELLERTYQKVKSLNQEIKVIFGGLLSSSDIQVEGIFIPPVDFLSSYNFSGYDAVGIHPYIGPRSIPYPPSLPPENSDKAYLSLPAILYQIMSVQKKPIWITEIGWPTNVVSEINQANFIIRALLISAMMGIEVFCIYEFSDSTVQTFHPAENNFGIVKSDYTPKTAYHFVKQISILKNSVYEGSLKVEAPSSYIVFSPTFSLNGKFIAVVWAVDSQGNDIDEKIRVKIFAPSVVEVKSVLGGKVDYTKAKNFIEVSVDSNPIFLFIK